MDSLIPFKADASTARQVTEFVRNAFGDGHMIRADWLKRAGMHALPIITDDITCEDIVRIVERGCRAAKSSHAVFWLFDEFDVVPRCAKVPAEREPVSQVEADVAVLRHVILSSSGTFALLILPPEGCGVLVGKVEVIEAAIGSTVLEARAAFRQSAARYRDDNAGVYRFLLDLETRYCTL